MSGIVPPGFVDFAVSSSRVGDPQVYVTTFACRVATPPFDQADLVTMFDNFIENWASSWPNDAIFTQITARVGQDGEPLFLVDAGGATGTNNGDFAPQNVALLIQKRSAEGGRRNRGRMFLPVITEASVSEVGVLTGTQLTSYQNVADEWLQDLQDGSAGNTDQMVILHSTSPTTPAVVTNLIVQPLVATQRRRLRR